jgi:hypothetical protein
MAPVMENQQMLATSMEPSISPQQRLALHRALQAQALKTVMAFGGADITKEERAAWEKENEEYKAHQFQKPGGGGPIPAGTRVLFRPFNAQEFARQYGDRPGFPATGDVPGGYGTVVVPGTPEAGKPGGAALPTYGKRTRDPAQPGPEWVAVKGEDSPWWFWRHRDTLEMQAPLEDFPVGTDVIYQSKHKTNRSWQGVVDNPPDYAGKPPGKDYVWVNVVEGAPTGDEFVRYYRSESERQKRYRDQFNWGAWVHKGNLGKRGLK